MAIGKLEWTIEQVLTNLITDVFFHPSVILIKRSNFKDESWVLEKDSKKLKYMDRIVGIGDMQISKAFRWSEAKSTFKDSREL